MRTTSTFHPAGAQYGSVPQRGELVRVFWWLDGQPVDRGPDTSPDEHSGTCPRRRTAPAAQEDQGKARSPGEGGEARAQGEGQAGREEGRQAREEGQGRQEGCQEAGQEGRQEASEEGGQEDGEEAGEEGRQEAGQEGRPEAEGRQEGQEAVSGDVAAKPPPHAPREDRGACCFGPGHAHDGVRGRPASGAWDGGADWGHRR